MPQSQDTWKPCVCEVDFDRVNRAALARSRELISALLPGGVTSGTQYVIPRQKDRPLLSIFLDSGRWSDFAIVAHGDDPVSLVSHVFVVACFRSRTPGPPPFSAMNSTPAPSSAF
jgi:hypothetical protein